jgi:NADH dehydrogenase FAD-containing subunit
VTDFARKTVEVEPAIPPPPDFARDIAGKPSQAKQEVYEIGYDKLVIAVGCYSASFGIPGVSAEDRTDYVVSRSCLLTGRRCPSMLCF